MDLGDLELQADKESQLELNRQMEALSERPICRTSNPADKELCDVREF
jgi:hypothetical protein